MRYMGPVRTLICLLLILPTSVLSIPFQQPETSGSRGREIYLRGLDPSGQAIKATLGQEGTEVSASVVPCASCHGLDGRGKAEGGVFPTSIRWPNLTRPYVVTTASGRKHPAYTESLLVRAVTMGIDSGGNALDSAMPRYQLSRQNARDLIAWLKELGAPDPGLTDASIEIGVFFSAESRFAELNSASQKALDAYFDEVNRNGGVYERRVVLRYGETSDSSGSFDGAFKEFLKNESPLALINSYIAGSEATVGKVLEEGGVPLIGAISLYPDLHDPPNRYIFYLNSGVLGQAFALADYAERQLQLSANGGTAVVLCGSEEASQGVAENIHRLHQKMDWKLDVLSTSDGPGQLTGLISQLKHSRAAVFLLLCPPAKMKQLLVAAASQADWNATFLIPASLATAEVFGAAAPLKGRVVFAVSPSPSDSTPQGMAAYRRLAQAYGLSSQHLATQLAALAESRILYEALVRAGRDLSREKLVEALEGMYDFQTGFTGTVSFGPNRRIGSDKVVLTQLDSATGQLQPLPQ